MDVYLEKLDYMKSISEQAESNGLINLNVLPDKIEITLKKRKMVIWLKNGHIEELSP